MSTEMDCNLTQTLSETDRKCPNCGGVMDYDASTSGLKCPFCDYEEEIVLENEAISSAEEIMLDFSENADNCNWGTETKTIICKSCGAESIYDAMQISATCPYCDSNQVTEAHTENTLAPGGVIPFQITDQSSADLFTKWIKKKWFCPKLAKQSAKAESFHGVYLPYWTFDATTSTHYSARYGITRTVGSGDKRRTKTSWYSTSGHHSQAFDDELILAATNYDTNMLKQLAPFNTAANKPYKPEYIAGFVAQRYSIGLKDGWELAKKSITEKLRSAITSKIRSKHRADQVANLTTRTDYTNLTYKYLLLPIWTSSFQYKGQVYHFMVNGQTGKVAGKTPISAPKVILTVAGILLVVMLYFAFMN
ncbi:MAG: hypothetical protein R3Y67_00965 [Eubacteriales bacterium]